MSSVTLLDGVANTGVIDLADVQLATYLAEKRSGGVPYFRHGKYLNKQNGLANITLSFLKNASTE